MGVARSSIIMASGTIASRILGFIRTVVLALTIGVTTDAADAFGVANQLPNNVYAIIAGGVLSAVLVPQIVKARSHDDDFAQFLSPQMRNGRISRRPSSRKISTALPATSRPADSKTLKLPAIETTSAAKLRQ